jgi:hypothetical protein
MVDFANKDYITSLTTASTDSITDGVDNIHTGIIKTLEQAARGNYIIEYNTAVFQQTAGSSRTAFGFSAAIKYMRDGIVTSADPTSVELASDPHGSLTRYDLIVIAANGALACRTGTENATPTVSGLTGGDIPVALVQVEGGTGANITTRKIQLYGYNKDTNAVSVAYSDSSVYTETLTIKGASTGSTLNNTVGDLTLQTADDLIIKLGTADSNSELTITDSADAVQFQVQGDGGVAAKEIVVSGLTASRALTTDSNKQLQESTTTATELGYVSGVTSSIQTQINAKTTLTGSTNNQVTTVTGAHAITGESGLTYSGTLLNVSGNIAASGQISGGSIAGIQVYKFAGTVNAVPGGHPAPTPIVGDITMNIVFATAANTTLIELGDPTTVPGNIIYVRNVSPIPMDLTIQGGSRFWTSGGLIPTLTLPPDTTFQFLAVDDQAYIPQAVDASHQIGLAGPTWIQIGA